MGSFTLHLQQTRAEAAGEVVARWDVGCRVCRGPQSGGVCPRRGSLAGRDKKAITRRRIRTHVHVLHVTHTDAARMPKHCHNMLAAQHTDNKQTHLQCPRPSMRHASSVRVAHESQAAGVDGDVFRVLLLVVWAALKRRVAA